MFNSRQVYEASNPKKLVHSHRGWLVCSAALLAMLGLGGYQISHADSTQAAQNNTDQQTNAKPQSINISHNTDAQQGFGNVDHNSTEMDNDLNSHVSGQQATKPMANNAMQNSNDTSVQRPAGTVHPDTATIQQHANDLHAHLVNQQAKQPVQQKLLQASNVDNTVNVHYMLNGKDVEDQPINVSGQAGQNVDITNQLDVPDKLQRTSSGNVNTTLQSGLPAGWMPTDPKTGLTAQPKGTHEIKPTYNPGTSDNFHVYVSSDNKTATITGNLDDIFHDSADTDLAYKGSLNLPKSVTTLNLGNVHCPTIINGLFAHLPNLKAVNVVGAFDTANVHSMNFLFSGDPSLTNINGLSLFNTAKVSDMSYMFMSDTSLSDISPLSNWNTHNLKTMPDMFSKDSSLSNIHPLLNWDLSNSLNGNLINMFASDPDLIKLPSWNISDHGTPGGNSDNPFDNEDDSYSNQHGNPTIWNTTTGKWAGNSNNPVYSGRGGNTTQIIDVPVEAKQPAAPAEAAPIVFGYKNQNGQVVGFTQPIANLGKVGQTVNVEPQLAQYLPSGYHLKSSNPVNITLNNDSYVSVNV